MVHIYRNWFAMNYFVITLSHVYTDGLPTRPNIVFILPDDMGLQDVGFNDDTFLTPNIDELASSGVILEQAYAQPDCSPSRGALMTGQYPFRLGLQHMQIRPLQPTCLPLNLTILPQLLKEVGYKTHIVGKWHLGACNVECTPTYRGFDSFYGYLNGVEDYYNHTKYGGLDMWDNTNVSYEAVGQYSTNLFASKAVNIIQNHNQTEPLFLYLPFQTPHYPIEVPKQYEDMYSATKSQGRRIYKGMVSAFDEAVGNVTMALRNSGMYDNTIIIFSSDNGGLTSYFGNNYPLRGNKGTIWEGGVRVPAFVHSPLLQKTGYRHKGLLHIVDWYATILSLVGVTSSAGKDSIDQSEMILFGKESKRKEFVYNLDDHEGWITTGRAGIRIGDYKLLEYYPGPSGGWYPDLPNVGMERDPEKYSRKKKVWLFNLKTDPNERHDITDTNPEIVEYMLQKLEAYRSQMVPPNFPPNDPNGDPNRHGGIWTTGWC